MTKHVEKKNLSDINHQQFVIIMLYKKTSTVLQLTEKRKGSLKSLAFGETDSRRCKQLFALACETLKYKTILDEIIAKSRILIEVKCLKRDPWLARVLVYELLFGKGVRGKYKVLLSRYTASLQSELARLKVKAKVVENAELLTVYGFKKVLIPRYARINTLKGNIKEVIQQLSHQFVLITTDKNDYKRYIEVVKNLKSGQFVQDIHIPELLAFAPDSNLIKHTLYLNGSIILQDKASCLPAYVLSEIGLHPGSQVIDSCAAPGNKTSHCAAILENQGKILAFDKDSNRIKTMKKLIHNAGTTCVEVINGDFLRVDVTQKKYQDVTFAVVDPSCTGSGIVSRLNQLTDTTETCNEERLKKLSSFQVKVLKHALSLPGIKHIVYSTCSVHEEENEHVLATVLKDVKDSFELCKILPSFPNRGLGSYPEIAPFCVRLDPEKDLTNGFFVACFKRKLNTDNHNNILVQAIADPYENFLNKGMTSKNQANTLNKKEINGICESNFNQINTIRNSKKRKRNNLCSCKITKEKIISDESSDHFSNKSSVIILDKPSNSSIVPSKFMKLTKSSSSNQILHTERNSTKTKIVNSSNSVITTNSLKSLHLNVKSKRRKKNKKHYKPVTSL